ncbi:hypothetical protein AIOGIFDO_01987 [Candidatus Methanoperedenaceae archaeon GB37]|nr:hypothetical protein AIOGIFDO_01987 [Candidatus Methanoperedenaceae archaeon GB37]
MDKLHNVAYSVSNSCLHSKQDRRTSRKRTLIERTFAVIKKVFNSAHVMITTVTKTSVKMLFSCFYFNLYQFNTLKRKKVI